MVEVWEKGQSQNFFQQVLLQLYVGNIMDLFKERDLGLHNNSTFVILELQC